MHETAFTQSIMQLFVIASHVEFSDSDQCLRLKNPSSGNISSGNRIKSTRPRRERDVKVRGTGGRLLTPDLRVGNHRKRTESILTSLPLMDATFTGACFVRCLISPLSCPKEHRAAYAAASYQSLSHHSESYMLPIIMALPLPTTQL